MHIRYFGDLDPSGETIERFILQKTNLVRTIQPNNFRFQESCSDESTKDRIQLISNTDVETMNKLKQDKTRFDFMKKYGLQSENNDSKLKLMRYRQ